jgi:uncharacterized protein (TIGR02996 family)
MDLSRAGSALSKGESKAALAALVAEWRARPLPRLADAIDTLAAFGPLFDDGAKNMKDRRARIVALVGKHGRDPRLARLLGDFLRDRPFSSTSAEPVYNEAVRALAKIGDPRSVPRAREVWGGLGAAYARMAAKLGAVPEPTPAETAELDALERAIRAAKPAPRARSTQERSGDALLAAVYADPDDDAARAVYADFLSQRGDPRGEFIALQLLSSPTAEQRRRANALRDEHAREWVGSLAPVLAKTELEFRRGFLSACACKARQHESARIAADPVWATVERVRFTADGWFFEPDVQKALRDVRVEGDYHLDALLDAPRPWRIERLRTNPRIALGDAALARLAKTDRLPALVALHLQAPRHGWFAKTRFASQLRELGLGLEYAADVQRERAKWLAELAKLPALERVNVHAYRARGTWLARDAERRFAVPA